VRLGLAEGVAVVLPVAELRRLLLGDGVLLGVLLPVIDPLAADVLVPVPVPVPEALAPLLKLPVGLPVGELLGEVELEAVGEGLGVPAALRLGVAEEVLLGLRLAVGDAVSVEEALPAALLLLQAEAQLLELPAELPEALAEELTRAALAEELRQEEAQALVLAEVQAERVAAAAEALNRPVPSWGEAEELLLPPRAAAEEAEGTAGVSDWRALPDTDAEAGMLCKELRLPAAAPAPPLLPLGALLTAAAALLEPETELLLELRGEEE
jgi:hypothetical protein